MSAAAATRLAGIVLAGGRSSRFGSDKLAVALDGTPLLHRAVAALAGVCDELLVVVPPDGRTDLPPGVVAVPDPEPFGGPLVGLLAGLEAARAPIAIVVGGDMPWLEPAVLRRLVAAVVGRTVCSALEAADEPGVAERLPLALRTDVGRAVGGPLATRGERRLRTFVAGLSPALVAAGEWTALDPAARTPRDVDTPADLGA